jgi:phage regulator Rha-like protein
LVATATMSSREIAQLVESRHDSVKRSMETLRDKAVISFTQSVETSHDGPGARPVDVYLVNKRDSYVVVAQLCPQFTARLVDRWQELEAQHAKPAELSRMDILKLAMESEQARIQAEAERDEAIRTKAMIGSKREATAMATAGAAKREAARLKEALGASARHATVRAVHGVTKTEYPWLPMRHWCKREQIAPMGVVDPLYGEVKAWPAGAWMDCHGVDLCKLFGGSA